MGTDYELQTIINAVVAKHTKALEEEMQSVMATFYRAKREELKGKSYLKWLKVQENMLTTIAISGTLKTALFH